MNEGDNDLVLRETMDIIETDEPEFEYYNSNNNDYEESKSIPVRFCQWLYILATFTYWGHFY